MSEVTPQACKGALGTWQLQEYPDMLGRRTMECPWKQTKGCRGGCGSALKPRVLWEGDRREAKVRTGLGKAHRPGSQGACGNVDHGGTRYPPHVSKERVLETLRLK